MLKMFSTQLAGLFTRIQQKEEFSIEDGGRLLAQAAAGHGYIYFYGSGEMNAVGLEAVYGEEPLVRAAILPKEMASLKVADRVLIASRYADDDEAVQIALELQQRGIPFVGISTVRAEKAGASLASLADVHIDLRMVKGLLPDDEGNRFGFPASMAALFVYYGLRFTIEEILEELI